MGVENMRSLQMVKALYTENIIKIKKGDEYINNPKTSFENLKKFQPRYNGVIEELSKLQLEYKEITGEEMNIKNKLNGF